MAAASSTAIPPGTTRTMDVPIQYGTSFDKPLWLWVEMAVYELKRYAARELEDSDRLKPLVTSSMLGKPRRTRDTTKEKEKDVFSHAASFSSLSVSSSSSSSSSSSPLLINHIDVVIHEVEQWKRKLSALETDFQNTKELFELSSREIHFHVDHPRIFRTISDAFRNAHRRAHAYGKEMGSRPPTSGGTSSSLSLPPRPPRPRTAADHDRRIEKEHGIEHEDHDDDDNSGNRKEDRVSVSWEEESERLIHGVYNRGREKELGPWIDMSPDTYPRASHRHQPHHAPRSNLLDDTGAAADTSEKHRRMDLDRVRFVVKSVEQMLSCIHVLQEAFVRYMAQVSTRRATLVSSVARLIDENRSALRAFFRERESHHKSVVSGLQEKYRQETVTFDTRRSAVMDMMGRWQLDTVEYMQSVLKLLEQVYWTQRMDIHTYILAADRDTHPPRTHTRGGAEDDAKNRFLVLEASLVAERSAPIMESIRRYDDFDAVAAHIYDLAATKKIRSRGRDQERDQDPDRDRDRDPAEQHVENRDDHHAHADVEDADGKDATDDDHWKKEQFDLLSHISAEFPEWMDHLRRRIDRVQKWTVRDTGASLQRQVYKWHLAIRPMHCLLAQTRCYVEHLCAAHEQNGKQIRATLYELDAVRNDVQQQLKMDSTPPAASASSSSSADHRSSADTTFAGQKWLPPSYHHPETVARALDAWDVDPLSSQSLLTPTPSDHRVPERSSDKERRSSGGSGGGMSRGGERPLSEVAALRQKEVELAIHYHRIDTQSREWENYHVMLKKWRHWGSIQAPSLAALLSLVQRDRDLLMDRDEDRQCHREYIDQARQQTMTKLANHAHELGNTLSHTCMSQLRSYLVWERQERLRFWRLWMAKLPTMQEIELALVQLFDEVRYDHTIGGDLHDILALFGGVIGVYQAHYQSSEGKCTWIDSRPVLESIRSTFREVKRLSPSPSTSSSSSSLLQQRDDDPHRRSDVAGSSHYDSRSHSRSRSDLDRR